MLHTRSIIVFVWLIWRLLYIIIHHSFSILNNFTLNSQNLWIYFLKCFLALILCWLPSVFGLYLISILFYSLRNLRTLNNLIILNNTLIWTNGTPFLHRINLFLVLNVLNGFIRWVLSSNSWSKIILYLDTLKILNHILAAIETSFSWCLILY